MDKHPGKRSFGGGKKFGGPKKFGAGGSFRKSPSGPRKFGGPRREDGEAPKGRVGGSWRAPGMASPSRPTKARGDFRPAHLRDGAAREGYAPRSYGDRPAPRFDRDASRPSYGDRPSRPFSRDDAAPRAGYTPRPYTPRSYGANRSVNGYGARPTFRRDNRPAPARAPERTSWGVSAEWYDGAVEAEGSYQKELILPNLLRLVSPGKNEKVADIACGQGFFAREMAKAGAKVSGVDISPELVAIAAERAAGAADFSVAPAHQTGLEAGFDQALLVLALQNIRELGETLGEISRILKKGGALHVVLNHPCFRIPKKSSWGFDAEANVQFRRLDAYLSDAAVRMEMHPGAAPDVATASFHRPLQAYFKALDKAGLSVTRLEEWSSHKTSQPGTRAEAENVARREFPLFMYLRAEKR